MEPATRHRCRPLNSRAGDPSPDPRDKSLAYKRPSQSPLRWSLSCCPNPAIARLSERLIAFVNETSRGHHGMREEIHMGRHSVRPAMWVRPEVCRTAWALLCALVLTAASAFAQQTTGNINGRVLDE